MIKNIEEIEELEYTKCGRTDKGVSAAGNVFSLYLNISKSEEKTLVNRINKGLPDDIIV